MKAISILFLLLFWAAGSLQGQESENYTLRDK